MARLKAPALAPALVGAAMVATSFLPATAAAVAPASRTSPPSIDQTIGEQGTNGFYVTVKVHDRDRLEVSATKIDRDLAVEVANYKMPYRALAGRREIKARFGKLGRVDMHFVTEKRHLVGPSASGCKGGKIVEEEGFWLGLLAFRGEYGFTQVRVHSAVGKIRMVPPLHCRPQSLKQLERALEALEKELGESEGEEPEVDEEPEEPPPPFVLVATARHHNVRFLASRESFGQGKQRSSESDLVVVGTRRRGRVEEAGTIVNALAPGSYIRPVDSREPQLETIVRPPEPFSGTATYRDPPQRPPSWTGDLKVELPGFGTVRLTGDGTHAVACESSAEPRCTRGLRNRAVALLQRLSVPG